MQIVDAKQFGLSKNTQIELDNGIYYLVLNRKSRIIMKDADSILAKVTKMRSILPDLKIEVKTTAPVCSKTRDYLKGKGIVI